MSRRKIIRQQPGTVLPVAETKKKCLTCGTTLSSYNPGPYCYAHTEGMAVKEHYPVTKAHSRVVPGVADDDNTHRDSGAGKMEFYDPKANAFSEVVTGVVVRDKKTSKTAVEDIEEFLGV